ncbi:MAG: aldolase [Coriobacteriaceae bacterium]|nr:aldolase [Coriobacteriaceae bacterium]
MAEFDFEQFKKDLLDGVGAAADTVASAAKGASDGVLRFKHFNKTGRDLFLSGSVTSHGGNMSVSDGTGIWISRTGSMLGRMTPGDVIRVDWSASDKDKEASQELIVHRAIYHALARENLMQGTAFGIKSIVHAHSTYTVFRSFLEDSIVPIDSESIMILGTAVPVLLVKRTIASDEVAAAMDELVRNGGRIAVVRGHGPFAIADSLEEAFKLISCLEQSAHLLTLIEQTGHKSDICDAVFAQKTVGDVL